MTPERDDGPSLQQYVETRFNLLTESLKDLAAAQSSALGSAIEALKAAHTAADIRYQQRFDAQKEALMAALEATKEAAEAAQTAASAAVAKAEAAGDKRYESLNELRQVVNDVVGTMLPKAEAASRFEGIAEKFDAVNKTISMLENRFNLREGETSGNRRTRDDTKSYLSIIITVVLLLLAVLTFIYARFGIRG